MSFRATSQDSRDPNSPQWGYLKVKNPEELQEKLPVTTDKEWNEYVMFVYDRDQCKDGDDQKWFDEISHPSSEENKRRIPARTDVDFVMVPAKLTVDIEEIRRLSEAAGEEKLKENLNDALKALNGNIRIPSGDIKFEKGAEGATIDTILWVALVIRPRVTDENSDSGIMH